MDCLLHQVLVAMLAATPAPDAPQNVQASQVRSSGAITRPANLGKPRVKLAKKGKAGTAIANVTVAPGSSLN